MELLNALHEEKRNQCKDMFCFNCLDSLNPTEVQISERLKEQAQKETPWEKELYDANTRIQRMMTSHKKGPTWAGQFRPSSIKQIQKTDQ
eukprot:12601363-Ditylum_brightwellii.AAC.1